MVNSFGELALLHNKKRAASIMTVEDTHFATMNKHNFDKILANIKHAENNQIVSFFNKFNFLKPLTYHTKLKIRYFGKEMKYVIGQSVFEEGEPSGLIYLIKEGEFEIRKEIYLTEDPTITAKLCTFRRIYSNKRKSWLQEMLNDRTIALFTDDKNSLETLKKLNVNATKQTVKVALRGTGNQVGLQETIME